MSDKLLQSLLFTYQVFIVHINLLIIVSIGFYSASALLAVQTAILAGPFLFVCHSVTFQYCVQTNEDTIMWFLASTDFIPRNVIKYTN